MRRKTPVQSVHEQSYPAAMCSVGRQHISSIIILSSIKINLPERCVIHSVTDQPVLQTTSCPSVLLLVLHVEAHQQGTFDHQHPS
jgi:hypothetical protein